jgi:hypothetical protein
MAFGFPWASVAKLDARGFSMEQWLVYDAALWDRSIT